MRNPFIIAEIGINHNGDLDIAKQLIDMAVRCGCDAVKFQKRTIDLCYSKEFLDSPRESPWGTTQRQQKEGLEFSRAEYDEIDKYCKGKIDWFASVWDVGAREFMNQYDVKYNKIPHQLWYDTELRKVRANGRHTFISMTVPMESEPNITIMLTSGKYPCPDDECHLSLIRKGMGFSCHNPSILVPALAVALGAEVIEVHITLDRTSYGSDQSASFEEEGLRRVVRDCRRVKEILGV
ncbi:hypothetical protein LCGC14_2559290 [marine sediment metagenome]|uniref:PseI/NeuA/B-like domain-containing protein n=1 Tax=marine sediment metagenome TaxID=412755 RepID=A0A0F9AKH0_9ZZZZ